MNVQASETDMILAPDPSLRGKRVLVVEDQALVALDLQTTLEDHGAEVVGPYPGLHRAMRAAMSRPALDAAVLDVDLGCDDVFPLAALLLGRGVPFALHTGHGDLKALRARYPGAPVILKPARAEDVVRRLVQAIGSPRRWA